VFIRIKSKEDFIGPLDGINTDAEGCSGMWEAESGQRIRSGFLISQWRM